MQSRDEASKFDRMSVQEELRTARQVPFKGLGGRLQDQDQVKDWFQDERDDPWARKTEPQKANEAKEMHKAYEYKHDPDGKFDKAFALRAKAMEDRKRKEEAETYLRMYNLKYENFKESAFDKSEALRSQVEADRKKREEAQVIVQNYSMNYGAEGDAYERTRSKLEEAKKKDREELEKTKQQHAAYTMDF